MTNEESTSGQPAEAGAEARAQSVATWREHVSLGGWSTFLVVGLLLAFAGGAIFVTPAGQEILGTLEKPQRPGESLFSVDLCRLALANPELALFYREKGFGDISGECMRIAGISAKDSPVRQIREEWIAEWSKFEEAQRRESQRGRTTWWTIWVALPIFALAVGLVSSLVGLRGVVRSF